jgi:3-hydroxymyristoyl/3-hydroxydecanoyl-(acyl carrier protein) dehydratase
VVEVYGSTETGGIAHRLVRDPAAPPPWTPLPGVTVTLSEREGVLSVESPFLATTGPFETGDRGSLLADGRFRLEGRKDRIVKLEERRISLLEIEERLKGCPEVDDARVVALEAAGARTTLGAIVVPSERGWGALAGGGKRRLRQHLHRALKPHLEALALPRRWRFVRRLPVSAQGKTSAASLTALFLPAAGRTVEPEIRLQTGEGQRVEIALRPQRQLVYFDGHFDAAAILPGVVQVDWAVQQARRCFAIPSAFHRIEALKFFHVLPADTEVTLVLEFDAAKARLRFSYQAGEITHSSGRVRFEAAS